MRSGASPDAGVGTLAAAFRMAFLSMYLLYSVLLTIALALGSPFWAYEMLRHGKYRTGLRQRLGAVPPDFQSTPSKTIWVHAVSVGEVLAVSELVRRLSADFPDRRIVVSTTTDTGQKLAASRFGSQNVFYFPLDFRFAARRWIGALRPELIVIAETEFWPNFLRTAAQSGARVAIVNARISDRSLPGYRRWRGLLRRILRGVDLFLAQTQEDANRLIAIGAPANRVSVAGNLKYDVAAPDAPAIVTEIRVALAAAGPVLVCGSTVEGEEALLLSAFQSILSQFKQAVMLLAPRHPQRFSEVSALLAERNIPFTRRSQWKGEPLAGRVMLIDSIGELAGLYALADIAFVGGSLVPRGGHNILEPAQFGAAIVVGPHTENFRDIVQLFQSRQAVKIVSAANLNAELLKLLSDQAEREALGARAAETVSEQRGATDRTLERLRELVQSSKAHTEREGAPA